MRFTSTKAMAPALLALGLFACASAPEAASPEPAWSPPPLDKPEAITTAPWAEVSVSVTDLDRTAQFFREIGAYETLSRAPLTPDDIAHWGLPQRASGESLLLRAPGATDSFVRLIRFDGAGPKTPTRPGAKAWDTGCYWSIMVRAKDMSAIYDDAIAMGWWTETPITYLEFGPSKLNVVVFKGPDGVQVQAYERIEQALPEGFPEFERISQPFNLMQMVRDREAFRELVVGIMGFETFWYGPPYVDTEPMPMPLGIPTSLTTEIPYRAGIFYPVAGETGRLEAIEIEQLEGFDFADRCKAPNLGILRVSYPVEDIEAARQRFLAANWPVSAVRDLSRPGLGTVRSVTIRAPDGGEVEFFQRLP